MNLRVAELTASAPSGGIFTDGRNRASVQEFSAGGEVLVAPGMRLSAAGGAATVSQQAPSPTYDIALSGTPGDRWDVAIGAERKFLAVTPRAIDHRIASQNYFARVTYWFDSRTSLALNFQRRLWSDTNRSFQGEAAFTHTLVYGKPFNLDAGALTHQQAFRQDMLAISGFFTPDHYSRYTGFLNTHGELGKFTWELRGEGGKQQITAASAFAPNWSLTARATTHVGGPLWLQASYERKNYSLLSLSGWYQGFYFSLAIRPQTGRPKL